MNSLLDKTFAASHLADVSMFDRPEVGTISSSIGKTSPSIKTFGNPGDNRQTLFEDTLRDALRTTSSSNEVSAKKSEPIKLRSSSNFEREPKLESSFSSMLKNKIEEARQLSERPNITGKEQTSSKPSLEEDFSGLKNMKMKQGDSDITGLNDENGQLTLGFAPEIKEVNESQLEPMLLTLPGQLSLNPQSVDLTSLLPEESFEVDLNSVTTDLDQMVGEMPGIAEINSVMGSDESIETDELPKAELEDFKLDAFNQSSLLNTSSLAQILGVELRPLDKFESLKEFTSRGDIKTPSLSTADYPTFQTLQVDPKAMSIQANNMASENHQIMMKNTQPLLQNSEESLFQNIFSGLAPLDAQVEKVYQGQDHVQASASDVTEQLIINEISKEPLTESSLASSSSVSKDVTQTSTLNLATGQTNKQISASGLNLESVKVQNQVGAKFGPQLEETVVLNDVVNLEKSENESAKSSDKNDLLSVDNSQMFDQQVFSGFNQDGASFGGSEDKSKQTELGLEPNLQPTTDARFGAELGSLMSAVPSQGDSVHGITQVEGKISQVSSNPTESEGIRQQFMANAKILLTKGGGEMSMVVDTSALGKIDLALQLQNNQLDVRVVGKEANVRDMIGMEIASLRDGLSQQGISLRTVEVATSSQGFSSTSQQGSWQQQHQTSYDDMRQYAEQSARLAKASQNPSSNLSTQIRTWKRPSIPTSALGQLGVSSRISVQA